MAKQHLAIFGLLVGVSALAACSSDLTQAGGSAGGAGSAGHSSSAGDAGSAGEAGSASEAGSAGDSNGNAGAGGAPDGFVFPDALNPQGVLVPDPGPASLKTLLVAGSDYVTTEVVSVALGTGKVGSSETYKDGDTVAVSSAGIGFALERTNDKVHLLDAGKSSATFDLRDPGADTAPVDSKAYVPLLNQSLIAILDLSESRVSRRIDLSEFNVRGDRDHSADISDSVYDPKGKVAYFVLQRVDRTTAAVPPYQIACSSSPALIVGIDAKTDEILDLNGSAAGKAIELELANPSSVSINADGSTLYLSAAGCYEGGSLKSHGVEVVDLESATSQVVYSPADSDRLSQLIMIGGNDALLKTEDASYSTHWFRLDIAAGELQGKELKGVPDAVTFDGTDVLGVQVTGMTGAVVRYDVASGSSTVVSDSSWAGKYGTAVSTALVQ